MLDKTGGMWGGKRMGGRVDGEFSRLFVRSAVALVMVASRNDR